MLVLQYSSSFYVYTLAINRIEEETEKTEKKGHRDKGKGKRREGREKASSARACTCHITHLNTSRDTGLSPQRKVLRRDVKPRGDIYQPGGRSQGTVQVRGGPGCGGRWRLSQQLHLLPKYTLQVRLREDLAGKWVLPSLFSREGIRHPEGSNHPGKESKLLCEGSLHSRSG